MPKLSAGFLLYRLDAHRSILVLLVHPGGPYWANKDLRSWSIPKGEYAPGDDPEAAAEREFREELGLAVPDGPRIDLGTVRQAGGKHVRAWAIRAEDLSVEAVVSNQFEMEWPPRSGRTASFPEVDRAEWIPDAQARARLVSGQVELLDRLARSVPGAGA